MRFGNRTLKVAALAAACLALGGAAEPAKSPDSASAAAAKQIAYYPQGADGKAAIDAALATARAEGKQAVIVFGADWCHDSRDLAKVLLSEKFRTRHGARFSVTFIDVGVPQTGRGRNLDLVRRLGIKDLKGTPAMFVISPKGKRLNSKKDAASWRNAGSRGEAAILDWFGNLK